MSKLQKITLIIVTAVLLAVANLQNTIGSLIPAYSSSSSLSTDGRALKSVTSVDRQTINYSAPYSIIESNMTNIPRRNNDFLISTTFLTDDFAVGKSCKREADTGGWECRDCSGQQQHNNNWTQCVLLQPRGECKVVRSGAQGWDPDNAPREESLHDPLDATESHRHVLRHYGLTTTTYEQMPCERLEDCWDMNKCASSTSIITVYGYGPTATAMAKRASDLHPEAIQWTEHPDRACLLLVTNDSFDTPEHMHNQTTWNGGRNHFLWDADQYFDDHHDPPFNTKTNFDHASVASASTMDAIVRLGYDVPTATMKMTTPEFFHPQIPNHTLGRRPTLVSFKGNFFQKFAMEQPWWQHRYLAYEYWEKAPDVFIDVSCKRRKTGENRRLMKPYTTPTSVYADLLLNATFAFCPGGGSVGSYRFAESLSMGAIPVVTSEFVSPLSPEVDWSGCLVRVSEARIVDLPRILRSKSEEEIQSRQVRCRHLFQAIWGWVPVDEGGGYRLDPMSRILPLALRIWSHRIENYHTMRKYGEAMLNERRRRRLL